MGILENEASGVDTRPSEDRESVPPQDTLQVPTQKRRKLKSPTPLRGRSATPIRGRSQTPFSLYLNRRSATPSTWRSITPFLKREEREKTPFELGRGIKAQTTCNVAVFDQALIMDISEPAELQKPVRYITSDMSVIDRAAVMDVSNVEVIYVVEEYDEEEEEEEILEEVKPKKKGKGKRSKTGGRRSGSRELDMEGNSSYEDRNSRDRSSEREGSIGDMDDDEPTKKGKKKGGGKKKDKKEKSPSPKMTLKLEIGGGQKASKKMFEEKSKEDQKSAARPPPKKSKLVLQMEEQARAAAKAKEEEESKMSSKPKGETFEERQKRLKAEKAEKERQEAEERALRGQDESLEENQQRHHRADHKKHERKGESQRARDSGRTKVAQKDEDDDEDDEEEEEYGDEEDSEDENEGSYDEDAGDSLYDDPNYDEDGGESDYGNGEYNENDEELDELGELRQDTRRSSASSEGFTKPDPFQDARWEQIAKEEGEEFMQQLRKYSLAIRKSEKQRDEEWKKRREQQRVPHFVVFLSDRAVEAGQKLRLACAVSGPDLTIKWLKDGHQIERDATHRIINNNNILILEVLNTNILHSGEYACIISNSNDEVTSSCYVNIYEVFKDEPAPPTFKLIKEYYHMRDDELTIEVHLHGVPRPTTTWSKGGIEIKPNYKFTMLEEAHGVYKLLIYKPNVKDNGTYTCKAINSSGEAAISHTIEVAKNLSYHVKGIFRARNRFMKDKEIAAKKAMDDAMKSKEESDRKTRVTRPEPEPIVSPKQKLKFATHLRDMIALEGSTVRLICNVIGPNSTYRWLKDDKPITYSEQVKNLSQEGKPTLELRKVTTDTSGVYKLIAKNEYSEIETSCYFKVYNAKIEGDESEPIFALPLRDVYHSSQNELVIDTKVRGNPRPTITWLKDRVPIVLDGRIMQIEHFDGICELIINKPTTNDNGTYICIATNKLGTQEAVHTVVVDIIQTSRRSSTQSAIMNETDNSHDSGVTKDDIQKRDKLPKGKKKDDEEIVTYERRSKLPEPNPKNQLYFDAILCNRYVAEGSKVKLQAVVAGPNPAMKWLKNDQGLTYGPRIRNASRDCLASLEFVKAMPEDTGIYTLIAQNEFCKITTSAQLVVYSGNVNIEVAPVFVRPLKDTYRLTTNELTLETGVRGQPTPKIQWFKDSMEVMKDNRHHIMEYPDGTCELIIDRPNKKDSGKYTVIADNSAGKAEITHVVTFAGKEHHIADNIHGVFHADKSLIKKIPKAMDVQFKEAQQQEEDDGVDGVADKGGKGKGKGRSKKTEDEEIAAAGPIITNGDVMKKREKNIGIHFATMARDRVVAEGSKVKISCFLNAKEPQVKWFKNEEPIQNGPKIKSRYAEGLCTLEIPSVTLADSGDYKCWARDETGEASTFCKLNVYSDTGSADVPPTFTRNIKDVFQAKVNELHLECHVRGTPTASITWVKDGIKIEPNDRYQQIDHNDGTCQLVIMCPKRGDSGKYICQAENRVGKAEIVHNVTFEPRQQRQISPAKEMRADEPPPSVESDEEKEKKRAAKKQKADEEETHRREVPPPPDLKKYVYLTNFLSNRTVMEGSTVKWVVNIDGPEPTARWFHNDTPIVFGPKTKMNLQDNIAWLQILKVTEADSGEYTIKVKGPENEVISSCNLFVYSTGKEELIAPVFTVGIKDTYSLYDNELVLECRVRGKPRPDVQWMKGSDYLSTDEKYTQIRETDGYNKLIIHNPTERDSGLYACVARNEVCENKLTHHVEFGGKERFTFEKTHGFFHRDPNKPHLVAPLGNQTVSKGGTIAINAEFLKTQLPTDVQWLRNNEALTGMPNLKTFYDKNIYTLAIMNATTENEGTYTCRAQNAYGRMESHSYVDISAGETKDERPPLFLSRPETEMKIAVGDPFSISFRISPDPKPKLYFMKGTRDITKSERVSKEASDDYIRFTVHKAQVSDSGTYWVVARNPNGTDRIFVTIEVIPRARSETPTITRSLHSSNNYSDVFHFKDPPAAISTEPLLVDSGPSYISLSWGKPPSNNAAPVIAYRVDAWLLGSDGGAIWKELGLTPINSFNAFNLKSHVKYHFRVTPKNRYGWGPSVQTTEPLQVGGIECLPEFRKILPGQVKALLHTEFILECVVNGSPRPDIHWYKDGIRIGSNIQLDRIKTRQMGSTCILIIKNVLESDGGRYTCEATNSKGRVSTFARLQIVEDEKLYDADHRLKEIVYNDGLSKTGDSMPIFTMRLRDRRVQVTYPVRLTCQVIGYPLPEVIWLKDDQPLQSNHHYFMTSEHQFHTLEVISTNLHDSGIYTCTARNELGSVSCHCSLVVDKGIRAYITPEFHLPLDPVYICQAGQQLHLTAKVEAYPAVGVAWYRNSLRLRPNRRLNVSLDNNGFITLTIEKTNRSDAGIYTCVASNAVGKAESVCRVCIETSSHEYNLHGPATTNDIPLIRTMDLPYSKEPLFVVKPRSSEAYEGDTVIICCEVVGDPKPDVVWLRDFLKPEYYKDAPHFRRIGDGPEYRLEIPYAKLDFTGSYSIIASNCYGEAKAVISLQIYAKDILGQSVMEKGAIRHGNVETLPRFMRHLRPLRCCDGDAVTLEAHVEGLPEPLIIWEKDGHVIPSGKDFTMTYDGIKATLSIPRIYPEDEGEYTCLAKNTLGRTLSSACIIVDVPEEKENMLQQQLIRPSALFSANSTPLSTPRSTPNRSFSPQRRFSCRNSSIDMGRRELQLHQVIAPPRFLAIPNSRVVEEGDSVRFQCAIAGHPTPWCTWDKEGMIVTPTARIVVKDLDDLRFMEINEVTFEDAGLYRITLENDYGRIEATARLDVISSTSRYRKSSSGRSVRTSSSRRNAYLHRRIMGPSTAIGGRMALAAGYRGSSVPSCKFYHNGHELMENERTHISCNDNEAILILDNVDKDDEGIYTCIIENDSDDPIATSTVVHIYEPQLIPPIQSPEIVKPLWELYKCCAGETIDLNFEMDCSTVYQYIWTKDGEIIIDSEQFNYIDHGNGILCLRIHDATDLDGGLYVCTVITLQGYKCSTSTTLHIEGDNFTTLNDDDDDDDDLLILKSPLPILAKIDDSVTFYCRIYPFNAHVTWFINGQEILANCDDEFTLESCVSDGIRMLHIENVTLNHSGEVQLVVTHSGKKILKKPQKKVFTSLTVIPRPFNFIHYPTHRCRTSSTQEIEQIINIASGKDFIQQSNPAIILEKPKDCTALIGGCIRLTVRFEGTPTFQVIWFKASRPIIETSNIIINTSVSKSVLQISDITADDSGKYSVQVMNAYGSDMAVASVAVEGPPDPPSGKPSISQGPDRISIAWCGPPYDGGCMLTGFILEMQEMNTSMVKMNVTDGEDDEMDHWQEIATVIDSLAYTVKGLKPLCMYRFRVRAENIHGRSEPSLPSEIVQIFQAHEVYMEDLQNPIHVKSGGEFKNRFDILEELGKGRFGVVYKVQEKDEPKRILAAKMIKCIKSRDRIKVQEEISIMRSLKHPKLLQLAATFETNREIIMVMEYITGGELFERVVADDFTLTERDCILFVRQICEGVAYMHTQQIVHLDLKPENIMCKTRTCHQIKIIDFGLAQRLNTNQSVRVLFGTPEFIAPEIISYEPIGFETDMWSVGVICYVLLSGLSPFMGDNDVETFSNITRAEFDFDDEAFDCVSQQAKDFISNLLVYRREERCSAQQCLDSSWLKQLQQNDTSLGLQKICTDKLKKFIIRRKWQKTGNAIRALGRMANLSASRRNSAISTAGSLPCSPRPSISLPSPSSPTLSSPTPSSPLSTPVSTPSSPPSSSIVSNANLNTNQMVSLHEENDNGDDFSIDLPATLLTASDIQRRADKISKARDKSLCSERSDSGYSECSNCSNNANPTLLCPCTPKEYETKDLVDHKSTRDLTITVTPVITSTASKIVQHELQDITKNVNIQHNNDDDDDHHLKNINSSNKTKTYETSNFLTPTIHLIKTSDLISTNNTNNNNNNNNNNNSNNNGNNNCMALSGNVPIMLSDFTNTIKMRKKSLENSMQRAEKLKAQKTSGTYEMPGKVTMLKHKFTDLIQQEQIGVISTTIVPITTSNANVATITIPKLKVNCPQSKDCMDLMKCKRHDYMDASHEKSNTTVKFNNIRWQSQINQTTSLPNTPISRRKFSNCRQQQQQQQEHQQQQQQQEHQQQQQQQQKHYKQQHYQQQQLYDEKLSCGNSPQSTTAAITFRLSDRVREVTDRLAQHQTICTEVRRSTLKSTKDIKRKNNNSNTKISTTFLFKTKSKSSSPSSSPSATPSPITTPTTSSPILSKATSPGVKSIVKNSL